MFNSIAAAPASCIDRVAGPTTGHAAVEAADHGNGDQAGRAFEQAQVPARAVVLVGCVREVGQRLGEALSACLGHPCVLVSVLYARRRRCSCEGCNRNFVVQVNVARRCRYWLGLRPRLLISIRPWWASRPSRSGCTGLMRRARRSHMRRTSSPAAAWLGGGGRLPAAVLGEMAGVGIVCAHNEVDSPPDFVPGCRGQDFENVRRDVERRGSSSP